jgi:hypothetical protein
MYINNKYKIYNKNNKIELKYILPPGLETSQTLAILPSQATGRSKAARLGTATLVP